MAKKEILTAKTSNKFFGIKKNESYVKVGRAWYQNGETHARFKNTRTGEVTEMPEMALFASTL